MVRDLTDGLYIILDTGRVQSTTCASCYDSELKQWRESGKEGFIEMAEKVVKIPEELYNKVRAKANQDGTSMAKALDGLASEQPLPEEVEAFVSSCAAEAGVKMPTDYRWIKPLTDVLPAGLRGKLEPYARVLECAQAKAELKKAAEEHLTEVEEAPGEVAEAEAAEAPA